MRRIIQEVIDAYIDAVYRKDVEAVSSLFADNVRVFDLWGSWSYESLSEWQKPITEWLSSLDQAERVLVTFEDAFAFEDDAMTVVTAIVTFSAQNTARERLRSLQNRLTWAIRVVDGVPQILHQHTSAPIDGEKLTAILHRPTSG